MSLTVTTLKPTRLFFKSLKIAFTITILFGMVNLNAADKYDLIDLGKFEEGISPTEGLDINNSDLVVGYSVKEGTTETEVNGNIVTNTIQYARAFSFETTENSLIDLGAIDNSEVLVEITNTVDGLPVTETINVGQPFNGSFGFAVNDQGTAIGTSPRLYGSVQTTGDVGNITETAVATSRERAIIIESGTITEVPDFVEDSPLDMRALGIRDNLIVGFGKFDDFDHGFIYDFDSNELTRIPPLSVDQNMVLRDINSSGYAVGVSDQVIDDTATREVVGVDYNSGGTLEKIEIFGGIIQQAYAINDNGLIVGQAVRANEPVLVAFSYDRSSGIATDLGVLNENFASSIAYGVNNSGQIVGQSKFQNSPDVFHAFIYENEVMKDLDKLIGCDSGWRLVEARAINEDGVIVGKGIFEGEIRGFMLKPQEGTAPNCELEDDSGSGSLPLWTLLVLALIGSLRRKRY